MEITKVKYVKDYVLSIEFDNKETKLINFESYLTKTNNDIIKEYLDKDKFKTAHEEFGDLSWEGNDLDFLAETIYNWETIKHVNILSVTDYSKSVNKTRQAILSQIKENRLPEGVTATLIGKTWIIKAPM